MLAGEPKILAEITVDRGARDRQIGPWRKEDRAVRQGEAEIPQPDEQAETQATSCGVTGDEQRRARPKSLHELPCRESVVKRRRKRILRRQAIRGDENLRLAAIAQPHSSISVRGRGPHHERAAVKVENDPSGSFDGTDRFHGESADGVVLECEAGELALQGFARETAEALEAGARGERRGGGSEQGAADDSVGA